MTDCYLACGFVDPAGFLGGRMRLDRAAAEAALAPIAARLGFSGPDAPARAAHAALRVATAVMATELAKGLAQRGEDAASFALMPFGGAGPTHANLLAEEAGLTAVLVPFAASTFCALGAVLADLKRDFVRSLRLRTWPAEAQATAALVAALAELSRAAEAWLAQEGHAMTHVTLEPSAEMRYAGQSFELTVDFPPATFDGAPAAVAAAVAEAFHRAHEAVYGFRDAESAIEMTAFRVRATGHLPPLALPDAPARPAAAALGTRRVFTAQGWRDWPVHARDRLGRAARIAGPAIIEQQDSTLVLLDGWGAEVDPRGNLELRRR